LSDDYDIASDSYVVGKIYADVSGSGNAPSITLYYEGNSDSHWQIPVNMEIFNNIYVNVTGDTMTGGLNLTSATTTGSLHVGDNLTITGNATSSAHIAATEFIQNGTSLADAYSPLAGSASITTVGTIGTGVWNGTAIDFSDYTNATAGTGITFTDDSISADLGTSIVTGEITDGTILEVDLNVTNSPTDNYVLSYDNGSGGFTWVEDATGSGLSDINSSQLGQLSDVSTSTLATADILMWNGSTWMNQATTTFLMSYELDTYSELDTLVNDETIAYGGGAFHDGFSDFVANEHIDWTLASQGTIHATNYVDNNTTYTGGTNITLTGTQFDVDDAFLVNDADDTTAFGLTLGSATTTDSLYVGGLLQMTLAGDNFLYFDNATTNYLQWDNTNDRFNFANDLYVTGNSTSTLAIHAAEVCIANDCKTAWPSSTSPWTDNGTWLMPTASEGIVVTASSTFTSNIVLQGIINAGDSTSFEITNGSSPIVDSDGEIAWDTTSGQFKIYGNNSINVFVPTSTRCIFVENLAAADDNFSLGSIPQASDIKSLWCQYVGTGTTVADISLEDGAGNAMTHITPTCTADGTPPTPQYITAGGALVAYEKLRFDVDNAVSPETDEYTICVAYKITAD